MDYFSGELECRQVIERARASGDESPLRLARGGLSQQLIFNFNINVKGKRAGVPAPHRLMVSGTRAWWCRRS